MLVECPECRLTVSDKAISCPHCGFPLETNTSINFYKPRHKYNKRRRLPNGFGQISEIKNRNLRKPFRAMITVGKDENGKPICKPLKPEAYFETYNDAYSALLEYNRNPYDILKDITVKELYEKWAPEHFATLHNLSGISQIKNAWLKCSSIYDMQVRDVRARHIKGCMETENVAPNKQKHIKTLFNMMLDYAVEHEIVDRNYSRTFNLPKSVAREIYSVKKEHIPFTEEEMDALWKYSDNKYVGILLIQCYSGWRPKELGLIKLADTDLENWTFTGGIKTDAGKNRTVPIHSRIRPLVEREYNEAVSLGSEYLLNYTGKNDKDFFLSYNRYYRCFAKIVKNLNLDPNHRTHDSRKHFVTMAKRSGVDEYAIKYIVGHAITDLTEKVYTKREIGWLASEIEKIK